MSFFRNPPFFYDQSMFQSPAFGQNQFGQNMMNHHYPGYQPPQPYYNNAIQQQPQQLMPDPLLQNYNMNDTNYIQWVIYLLKNKLNVLMVCFDFDKVLTDIHTGGRWTGSAEELAKHVRPCFRFLIPELFKERIHVCVVTYSGQEQLIRDALRIACNLW